MSESAPLTRDVDALKARLRQIDDYQRKGLLRAEDAETSRQALLQRLMRLAVPDAPLPRLPWRVHLVSLLATAALVGSVCAYLWSGHAGLRRHSEEMLAEGRVAAAQQNAARRERLARRRAGLASVPPDRFGRFDAAASTPSMANAADATGAPRATNEPSNTIAPLLSGRVELDPALRARVAPDDALFVVVRRPDDPAGLPLATQRVEAGNLPFDFEIGAKELLGSPGRFMTAREVVVSARISRSGSGLERPGDLVGTSAAVAPWSGHVRIVIARVASSP